MNRLIVRALNRLSAPTSNQASDQASDQGGVAAEYGVLLAGIVALVAVAATALGGRISDLFDTILP
jgi:Flp pilus assembly pilin Flp